MNTLTQEQAAFAADHHELIYAFLRDKGYHPDEYYDVVVFGYLDAVQRYLEREALRQYAFSTIAYRAMRRAMWGHFRSRNSQMRRANVVPLDNDIHTSDNGAYDPEAQLLANDGAQAVMKALTPTQGKIIYLRADGYNNREIGKRTKMKRMALERELSAANAAASLLIQTAA